MQEAVPVGEGAMAALLGADLAQAQELAKAAAEGAVCQVANDNAPGQVVISGAKGAIERAVVARAEIRRAPGCAPAGERAVPLRPDAARRRRDAGGARRGYDQAARGSARRQCLAAPITDPEMIRAPLVEQVTGMVRWRETMLYLKELGVSTVYEVGAGRVLTGIVRRFDGIEAKSVGLPEEVEAAASALVA